ncbi:MAG: PAS domain S-box protein, partial [Nitrosomonas sp.]|nr:PAS domain S-box protein [Nitrosomonas sp.]
MFENYITPLVFLSVGIAFLASYTAIDLALRMNSAAGRVRKFWHVSGSIALGVGVWGMHFIGMLAFKLPVSVTYDIFLTFISFLPAALASMVVLWVMSRSDTRWSVLLLSSVVMGVGISSMHYVGMLAMQITPSVKYDSLWFILSFVIAIVLSFVTLLIISRLDLNTDRLKNTRVKLLCAMSMAAAISGMHYTGMAAAIFPPEIVTLTGSFGLGGDWLATLVGIGVVMILLSFSIAAIVDARFADQNMRMANKLKELNRKLIAHANSVTQIMVEKEAALSAVSVVNEELAHAKELAEQSSAELAVYLEAIDQHALISVTDNRGRIVRVNEKFIQVSGYSREELLNQDHRIVNSGMHPKAFFVEMWRTLSRGDIWRNEICNRAKDGSLYWIDTAIVPLKNEGGKIVRYISVRVNVTRYKEIEAELLHAMDAAEAANEAKSRFLANMSHEIRTPMNSILGMAHLLRRTEINAQQLGYIANIQRSSEHLLTIINDVLDLSKIEAGKINVT